ncbi:MAG: hypothetical protein ACXVZU_01890 [Methanobacteriaceae archaeon]
MNKKAGLISLLVLVILVAGVSAYAFNNQPYGKPIGDKSTKLALYNNNPNVWLHVDLQLEKVKLKNGKRQTLYVETFMKPAKLKPDGTMKPGSVTIDLSQLLGYGNHKLPAGTTIRILSWKGLYNPKAGGSSNLNLNMQGWSNTRQPGSNDQTLNIQYQPLPITKLPRMVKGNQYWVSNKLRDVNFLDNDNNEPIFEEELLTVDPNGKVTIKQLIKPTLCFRMANHRV